MQVFENVVANLPKPILKEFKRALVLGHWQNGIPLTAKQRDACEIALKLRATNPNDFNPLTSTIEVRH